MRKITAVVAYTLFGFFYAQTLGAQMNQYLDYSFNGIGKNITAVGTSHDEPTSVVIQPSDGKILVAGSTYNGSNYDFTLVRYNTNGIIDNTFGNSGIVTTAVGAGNDYGRAVAIQADGKIIVAGYTFGNKYSDFAIIRYNSSGTLDNTFGNNGKVIKDINGYDDAAYSIQIRPNGKLVFSGRGSDGNYDLFTSIQLKSDGNSDSAFGINGISTVQIVPNKYCRVYSSLLQPDGKIILGGNTWVTTTTRFAICRINIDGSLDNTFGTGGTQQTSYLNSTIYSLALQPDGQIVAAGVADVSGSNATRIALAKYQSNGSLQSNFKNSTTQFVHSGGNSSDVAYSVALKQNGDIIIAGSSNDDYQSIGNRDYFLLAYFDSSGYLQSSNSSVSIMSNGATVSDVAYTLAIQPDNKVILAGTTVTTDPLTPGSTKYKIAVARYTAGITGIYNYSNQTVLTKIYLNPTTKKLSMNFGDLQADRVYLYTINGQLLSEIVQPQSGEFDVSGFPQGVFVAEIHYKNSTERIRWVKM